MSNEAQEDQGTFDREMTETEHRVVRIKALRKCLDEDLQEMKALAVTEDSQELRTAHTYTTNAVMWLGMELKRMNQPNPYPNSKNPDNTKIDPTADNLKM